MKTNNIQILNHRSKLRTSFLILLLIILNSCLRKEYDQIPPEYSPPSIDRYLDTIEVYVNGWDEEASLIGVYIPLASPIISDNSPSLIRFTFTPSNDSGKVLQIHCLGDDCQKEEIDLEIDSCFLSLELNKIKIGSTDALRITLQEGGMRYLDDNSRVELGLQQTCESDYPLWMINLEKFDGTGIMKIVINAENGEILSLQEEVID